MIKKILLSLFCIILMGCSQTESFKDSRGEQVELAKLKGSWVLVNFWAPWCHSCVREIEELNSFYKHYPDIKLYGVDFDHPEPAVLTQIKEQLGIQFPVLLDNPSSAWNLSSVDFVPTTFIINPEGKVVETLVGPTTERDLLDKIHKLKHNR